MDQIEQIRRAHASAQPKHWNPAWQNCHCDCGVLLGEIERLRTELAEVAKDRDIYYEMCGVASAKQQSRFDTGDDDANAD